MANEDMELEIARKFARALFFTLVSLAMLFVTVGAAVAMLAH